MRKKLLLLLLALLLACPGCAPRTGQEEAETGQTSVTEEETAQPEDTTQEEAQPEEPETLDWSALALEGLSGVYDLSALEALDGLSVRDAALMGQSQAVLLTGAEGRSAQLLNLETGALEELYTVEALDAQAVYGADADDEEIVAGTDYTSFCSILSAEPLVVLQTGAVDRVYRIALDGSAFQVPDTDSFSYYNACYTDEAIYTFQNSYQSDSGSILRLSYDGTERTELARLPAEYLYGELVAVDVAGSRMILHASVGGSSDLVTLSVDLTTGQITTYQGQDSDQALYSGVWMGLDYPEEGYNPLTVTAWQGGQQASLTFDLNCLDTGAEDFSVDACYLDRPDSGGDWGRCIITGWDGSSYRILLWDYSDSETQAVAAPALTEYTFPTYDLGELSQRAAEMEETYGIRIYLGEEVTSAPFPDYTLAASEDLQAMSQALDVLEAAFAYYPDNYLSQLGGDSVRELCFYLTGTMTPIDPSVSIDNPGGLTCQVDGLELLAFNVAYIRTQDVVHELTHVLDHQLWAAELLDEETWNAMNPEGFAYYNAYVDENGESYEYSGSTQYTTWDSAYLNGDTDSVYFIDPYSTTYPTEDRARMMEYLVANDTGTPDASFASVHLQEKMQYYAGLIRQAFDTTGWPEQTVWESALASMAAES